jgi:hypothetical protein
VHYSRRMSVLQARKALRCPRLPAGRATPRLSAGWCAALDPARSYCCHPASGDASPICPPCHFMIQEERARPRASAPTAAIPPLGTPQPFSLHPGAAFSKTNV